MQGSTRLSGTRIILEKSEKNHQEDEIIIFDEVLSSTPHSKCNLGFIKSTNDIAVVKTIQNRGSAKSEGQFLTFKQKYVRELKNFYEASQKYKKNQHSNIVDVYPLSMLSLKKTHAYIVMQFCKNGNLEVQLSIRRLNSKWFTFAQFYNMMCQILSGYQQLYSCNILHQNLKPSNILLDDKYVKIGNFSLSQKLNNAQNYYNIYENPYYSAPDKHKINYTPSSSSDIFSLGVIFFEMIFDQHPYCKEKSLQSCINSRLSLKNSKAFQTKRQFDTKIRNQIINNQINLRQNPIKYCMLRFSENKKSEEQNLKKILSIIDKMLEKQKQKRITFLQIMKSMEKIVLQNQQELQFMNKKYIPKKFEQIIRTSSIVQIGTLHFKNSQLKDLQNNPPLSAIRQCSEKINLISHFLEGITARIQKQIRIKEIEQVELRQISEKLLLFNYTITYIKYNQILQKLGLLSNDNLMEYYSIGLDRIFLNTKSNKQYLQNQILQICIKKQMIEQQVNKTYQLEFQEMSEFIRKKFIQNDNKILDQLNVDCYLLILLIMELVQDQDPSIQKISKLIQKYKQIEANIGNQQPEKALKLFEKVGIKFAMASFNC